MEGLVHPSRGADFSVYLSGGRGVCGTPLASEGTTILGRYDFQRRSVVLHPVPSESQEVRRRLAPGYRRGVENFIHEFAHHVYFQAIAGTPAESALWDLYQWSVRQSENTSLANLNSLRRLRGYFPNDILLGLSPRQYSRWNVWEFFAEMFAEQLSPHLWTRDSPGFRARRELVDAFLDGHSLRLEAFGENGLRGAYARHGIDYRPLRWLPTLRLEAILGSRMDLGLSIFAGTRHSHPLLGAELGLAAGVEHDIDDNFWTGFLKAEFSVGVHVPQSLLPLEFLAVGRLGGRSDGFALWPTLDLGARISLGLPLRGHSRGFNLSGGFYQELDLVRGNHGTYGALGFGYSL